ncbi:molybdopterin-dependent oxidoreductase [Halomonas sp.]|uniref:molybdopterin-dependent oxidoreductase n=1 Tax=Halomonas sp. TaxID=1486246 RepID=UPI003563EC7B
MAVAVGGSIPFADRMPGGLIPAALAQSDEPFTLKGKEGLAVLNDRPINAETPPHLLDDDITPGKVMFVRNNGIPPALENIDVAAWQLEIGGESCANPQSFSIADLKEKFEHHTYQLQVECGGNGRSEYVPSASGNQWTTGAVACPTFTGVRLRDVLEACGIVGDGEQQLHCLPFGQPGHPEQRLPQSLGEADPVDAGHPGALAAAGRDRDGHPRLSGGKLRAQGGLAPPASPQSVHAGQPLLDGGRPRLITDVSIHDWPSTTGPSRGACSRGSL